MLSKISGLLKKSSSIDKVSLLSNVSMMSFFRKQITNVAGILLVCLCGFSIFSYTPIMSEAIRRYIMANPNTVIESLQEMEKRSREASDKEAKEVAKVVFSEVASDDRTIVIGNKDAKNSIVVFYDYSCGYCKSIATELKSVLDQRNDVKILLQDFPIMDMSSVLAAKASIFVGNKHPELMAKFFFALMAEKSISESSILAVGKSIGLSNKELKDSLTSAEFESVIRDHYSRASRMKVNGTPVFIINGNLTVGALSASQMIDMLDGKIINN